MTLSKMSCLRVAEETERSLMTQKSGSEIKKSLTKGLLATGFAVRNTTEFSHQLKTIDNCLKQGADIRRSGSAALDLAYTACGRLDGFWEFGLNPWDVAAGSLIVIESGGIVTDKNGTENYKESGSIVAGNPKIVKALLKII